MRHIALLTVLILVSAVASAATYKCKDAQGKWTEAACTGNAAPPAKPQPFEWNWKPRVGMHDYDVSAMRDRSEKERAAGHGYGEFNPWFFQPKINRTTSASGSREQWVFDIGDTAWYLYFENGVLTSIQD